MNILIAGASSGYGAAMAKKFRDEGHRVYTAQRRPEKGVDRNDPHSIATWFELDWADASQCVRFGSDMMLEEINFDVFIYAVAYRETIAKINYLNGLSLARVAAPNILNVVGVLPMLVSMKIIKSDAILGFMLDGPRDSHNILYELSKAATIPMIQTLMKYLPDTLKYHFIMPPKERDEAMVAEKTLSIFDRGESGTILDLR